MSVFNVFFNSFQPVPNSHTSVQNSHTVYNFNQKIMTKMYSTFSFSSIIPQVAQT